MTNDDANDNDDDGGLLLPRGSVEALSRLASYNVAVPNVPQRSLIGTLH